ncbi:hypothetical protein Lcho_2799 [Leptothrix cholodnii SP-6]|uniref:Uncharacterized protein n=1 Tax=Leptothrix cholodnii (strain ATCC 51168 / LMG 8142 / SP-6) TaxID=395495 RepID=B1XXE4_LEPCP|nr:hypothetical protein [Leptothrix cholodnii]ACB35064.1 hypothetical protein Lcho_2799 [Leptothrix cholodnii SP-6]
MNSRPFLLAAVLALSALQASAAQPTPNRSERRQLIDFCFKLDLAMKGQLADLPSGTKEGDALKANIAAFYKTHCTRFDGSNGSAAW